MVQKKQRRVPITMRIHPTILAAFRAEAARQHVGYQSLMQAVLRDHARVAFVADQDRRTA